MAEAEINGRADSAALNHRAVVRGGLVLNKHTHLSNSHNSNHDHYSDSNSNNNTTVSADNNYIVDGLIAELGARMTTGPMQSGGTKRNLRLLSTRPWRLSLSVGGVAS